MSEQEKHELIGRVFSESKQTERDLQMLKAKAIDIGEKMIFIGNQLREYPEHLGFKGEPYSTIFSGKIVQINKDVLPDFNTLNNLCKEIRNLTVRLQELEEQKKRFEI